MTIESNALGQLLIAEESTFGTDASSDGSSLGSFLNVPFVRGTFNGGRDAEQLNPMTNHARKDVLDKRIQGYKSAAPAFDLVLASHGVVLDGSNSPVDSSTWGLGLLLKTMLGSETTETAPAAQTQVQAGSTVSSIVVTAGHGSRWGGGRALGITIDGKFHAREILSRSTDTLTLKVALPSVPATNAVVHGSNTYALAQKSPDTIQAIYLGKEATRRYSYLGCQGSLTFDMTPGQLFKGSVSLMAATWAQLGAGALPTSIAATNYSPVANRDACLYLGEVGSTTLYDIKTTAREWTLNLSHAKVESTCGIEGVAGYERTTEGGQPALSGSFGIYRDGSQYDFEAAYEARTSLHLAQQIGNGSTGAFLLTAPEAQVWIPKDDAGEGLNTQSVAWFGGEDQTVGGTNDLSDTAFRLHCFGPTA